MRRERAPGAPRDDDPQLGPLAWDRERGGWCGALGGVRFVLEHENPVRASEELKRHALEVLREADRLRSALAEAVRAAPPRLSSFREEMAALRLEELRFCVSPKSRYVLATLGPGREGRSWQVEFADGRCRGIDFDC